jgi:plasmid stability protein
MNKLTIRVDEEVLTRARIRALRQGTSVKAVLRAL